MRSRPPHNDRGPRYCRRGVALLGFVTALLIIGSLILWLFQVSAASSTAAIGQLMSTGAFYAAEGGVEMAAREVAQGTDYDSEGTGTLGTISDNGIAADDPATASGAVYVELVSPSPAVYRAIGRPAEASAPWNGYRRVIEFRME